MRQMPDRQGDQDGALYDSGRAAGCPDPAATAMLITDTTSFLGWSRAVSDLIGASLRDGDVDSTTGRRTAPTTPATRTSRTATRTGTTRTTATLSSSSEESCLTGHAALSFEALYGAYLDCRRRKRTTASALRFELNLEQELTSLYEVIRAGAYWPGRSICFVVKHPKPREVWAADFRDRVVHHLVYNFIGPRFERTFIADTSACIKGRGAHYAIRRLEGHARSITQNWTQPAWYLKCDLQNFFVSINKALVWRLLVPKIPELWLLDLAGRILWHDCRQDFEFRGASSDLALVPPYKRLTLQPSTHGLPIGNLPSQLDANILLNRLDQRIKHRLGARHYCRYVDDFVVLGHSPQWLNAVLADVSAFLPAELELKLNERKTVLQPVHRGIDFVGQVITPIGRRVRRRVVRHAERELSTCKAADLAAKANSFFGLFRQATQSRQDRVLVARACLRRGRMVDGAITKTYPQEARA